MKLDLKKEEKAIIKEAAIFEGDAISDFIKNVVMREAMITLNKKKKTWQS